jgi:hypothetical protein
VSDLTPTRKVAAGGVGGAATIVLVWLAGMFGLEMPPEVAAALTVLLGTGAAYLRTERPR